MLAALVAAACALLPMARAEAVLFGMLISFAVYAGAAVWVFSARTAWRAWMGLAVPALPLAFVLLFGGGVRLP